MRTYLLNTIFLALSITICFSSCTKDVDGCTDSQADNYNSEATQDDGSCTYPPTTPTTPATSDYTIEFIVYDGSGSGTVYNTNLDVYDGTTFIGNLSNYTTTLYGDDLYSVTTSQNGLTYDAIIGQGENINVRNASGDTVVMFGGNFVIDAGQLDLPDGFSTPGNTAIRLQSINSGSDLIMSIESL